MRTILITLSTLCIYLQSCISDSVPNYVGVYKLYVAESKLGMYKHVDSIQDLTLTINADSTFQLSKDVPFIRTQKGRWTVQYITTIDNPPFYRCSLIYNDHDRNDRLLPWDEGPNQVYINYPVCKEGHTQVELLRFLRVH